MYNIIYVLFFLEIIIFIGKKMNIYDQYEYINIIISNSYMYVSVQCLTAGLEGASSNATSSCGFNYIGT